MEKKETHRKPLLNIFRNCEEATFLISRGQEAPLSFAEKLWLRIHLLYCSLCRRFKKQSAVISRIMENPGNPVSLSDTKKKALEQLILDNLKNNS